MVNKPISPGEFDKIIYIIEKYFCLVNRRIKSSKI